MELIHRINNFLDRNYPIKKSVVNLQFDPDPNKLLENTFGDNLPTTFEEWARKRVWFYYRTIWVVYSIRGIQQKRIIGEMHEILDTVNLCKAIEEAVRLMGERPEPNFQPLSDIQAIHEGYFSLYPLTMPHFRVPIDEVDNFINPL